MPGAAEVLANAAPPLAGAVLRDAGDSACVLEFGDTIERAVLERVGALDRHVRALAGDGRLDGLVETVPTFRSLALLFDPLVTEPATLLDAIAREAPDVRPDADAEPREWSLPVRYGGAHGPDLEEVAVRTRLSTVEVIERHTGTPLIAYMLGFLPGFAFLGDIDADLRLPRRETPRLRVPPGSVAIANGLSAVYPWQSPGGWHLLGHCPVPLFADEGDVPALLRAGDTVRFHAVEADEHAALTHAAESGKLAPERFRLR